jgi:hypothetical protein
VMQQQNAFVLPPDRGRHGLLQIPTPTQEEITAAAASVSEASSLAQKNRELLI